MGVTSLAIVLLASVAAVDRQSLEVVTVAVTKTVAVTVAVIVTVAVTGTKLSARIALPNAASSAFPASTNR
jgi:hypothetical protein